MIVIQKENETLEEALKRTLKEKEALDRERQLPKELNDTIGYQWEMAIVFSANESNQIFLEEDKEYTFGELLNLISDNEVVKYIMLESALNGELWQCGNCNDNKVYYHATTKGYA